MRLIGTLIIVWTAVLWPLAASADPVQTARDFADQFAIPRFQALASAAHDQERAWAAFCAKPARGDAAALTHAFNAVADDWASVEFVTIGPASVALRAERFNYWLDRNDATGKSLNAMLAATDSTALAAMTSASGSVAGQGLPVLERLLFGPDAIAQLRKADTRRCVVGSAVAHGLSTIADDIVTDWTAPNGARGALAANGRWGVAFADGKEAASVMLTNLVAGLEGLKDNKVAMLFHDVTNAKAPRLAEATRSGRTARDISLNLTAIREASHFFLAQATVAQKTQLDAAFDDAARSLKPAAAAEDHPEMAPHDRLVAVVVALSVFGALSQTAIAVLPQATGLTLGFNGLDGD